MNDQALAELLKSVEKPSEAEALQKAWKAMAPLAGVETAAPVPCPELDNIFRGGEAMDDDDLNMLAAAGTGMTPANGTDNVFVGTDNSDSCKGTTGNDTMYGLKGNDTLLGGDGDDCLVGGEGHDSLVGGDGDDMLLGGEGDDVLVGGKGDDTLAGGSGFNELAGGSGNDCFVFGAEEQAVTTINDFMPGRDRIILNGVRSMDDFKVEVHGDVTVVEFGATTIIIEGVEISTEDIWSMQD